MRERYWIDSAPGYVRLRHELGTQSRMRSSWSYNDGRSAELLAAAQEQGLISLEPWSAKDGIPGRPLVPDLDDEDDFEPPYDPRQEEEDYWAELGWWMSLDPDEQAEYERTGTLERLQKTAAERSARGGGGLSAKRAATKLEPSA